MAVGDPNQVQSVRRLGWTHGIWTIAAAVAMIPFVFWGGSSMTERTKSLTYEAAASGSGEHWTVMSAAGADARLAHAMSVHAALTETIEEEGPSITRRARPKQVGFVDRRISRVELELTGLDPAAEWKALADKLPAKDPELVRLLERSNELQSKMSGLTPKRTPEEQQAAREAILAYFAEERPDLVERIRGGELVRVIYRSTISSRQLKYGGLGLAAVLGAIGWGLRRL